MEELKLSFGDEESAIQFCLSRGLIKSTLFCTCKTEMSVRTKKGRKVWACSQCARSQSIFQGSIFQVSLSCDLYG